MVAKRKDFPLAARAETQAGSDATRQLVKIQSRDHKVCGGLDRGGQRLLKVAELKFWNRSDNYAGSLHLFNAATVTVELANRRSKKLLPDCDFNASYRLEQEWISGGQRFADGFFCSTRKGVDRRVNFMITAVKDRGFHVSHFISSKAAAGHNAHHSVFHSGKI